MPRVEMYNARVIAAVKKGSRKALIEAGARVEREAKQLLEVGGGPDHIPAPPGEPPHLQSGDLRSGVDHDFNEATGSVVVGPTVKYGAIHEFGLRTYPPRPFMRPALRNVQGRIPSFFRGLFG